jgi:hypothetical protein
VKNIMSRNMGKLSDPERGRSPPLEELGGEMSDTLEAPSIHGSGGSAMNTTSEDPSLPEAHGEPKDFNDGANALWSLYGNVAQTHDESYVQSLA